MTRPLEIGLVLAVNEHIPSGEPIRWPTIRAQALQAEEAGFDGIWIPDELLWESDEWSGPRGFWECVATTAAVAEATSTVTVGTWVLSALHRNAALTAKVVSTLDEVSDGRLVFGFGAGHSGKQGAAYGYPPDKVVSRYEEALRIVVPLVRGEEVGFEGEYHRAALKDRPRGPQAGSIPIMLAGHGPRNIGLAVQYGDIWSAFATKSSKPEAFREMLDLVDAKCGELGRDPSTLKRSIGIDFVPHGFDMERGFTDADPLTGSADQLAEAVGGFAEMGVTNLEWMVWPATPAAMDAACEVLALIDR